MKLRMLRKIMAAYALLPLLTHAAERPAASGETKDWRSLFDGTVDAIGDCHLYNLPDTAPERWSVEEGALTLRSREEAPDKRPKEDLVITERGYRDFELEFDWKVAEGANSGIFYRVLEEPRFDKPWHTGLEYQLLDDANHKEGKIATHRAGDLYDLVASSERAARPALAWNRSRIVARGTQIAHWLDGKLTVSVDTASPEWHEAVENSKYSDLADFAQPVAGQIVLQDHGNRMWFRNIRIREL